LTSYASRDFFGNPGRHNNSSAQSAPQTNNISVAAFILFSGGVAVSMYLIIRGAETVSKVVAHGCLLGAVEWLLLIGIGHMRSDLLIKTLTNSNFIMAVSWFSGNLVPTTISYISIAMTIACSIGFAVMYLINREMDPKY
jgi:hypothetical protein